MEMDMTYPYRKIKMHVFVHINKSSIALSRAYT